MQAVGQLAGGIAHDFNNMLGGIIGYTELALVRIPPDDPAESLAQVLAAAERAKRLVERILTFNRGTTAEMKAVKLGDTVAEVLTLLILTTCSS